MGVRKYSGHIHLTYGKAEEKGAHCSLKGPKKDRVARPAGYLDLGTNDSRHGQKLSSMLDTDLFTVGGTPCLLDRAPTAPHRSFHCWQGHGLLRRLRRQGLSRGHGRSRGLISGCPRRVMAVGSYRPNPDQVVVWF